MSLTTSDIQRYRQGGSGFVAWAEENVRVSVYTPGLPAPEWILIKDLPDIKHKETGRSPAECWYNMAEVTKRALVMKDNELIFRLIVFCWMRGECKCESKGSKVLMFDGSVKNVEDVIVGDLLMGDDNASRKVLSLVNGKEEMFEVVPVRGESMTVTADHMLTLKETYGLTNKKNRTIDISVNEFVTKSGKFQRGCRLFKPKTPLSFSNEHEPLLDPYLSGLKYNKLTPHYWRTVSVENRLQFLAGCIDGNGCNLKGKHTCYCVFSSILATLEEIEFVARSLGFSANRKEHIKVDKKTGRAYTDYKLLIDGDIERIPVKLEYKHIKKRKIKNWNVTGIKEIKSAGEQEYYGFALDGNSRYVKGDFTVTHNSFLACLIQMWKFYCFPKQLIVLAANSKDQVKFVHFDIIRDIILNSPKLLAITGRKNIQEKEIRLKNKAGAVMSTIRSISSFSGIVSNITGYTFSEIFDLKNSKFFYQLDGSIRNIPNALGVIDSTVSTKQHILYRLYKIWESKKDPFLFFSYRHSPKANYRDYWHPAMTKRQLNSFRIKMPTTEFNQYFKNTWASGSKRLFSFASVMATHFLGFGNQLGMQATILKALAKCLTAHNAIKKLDHGLLPIKVDKAVSGLSVDRTRYRLLIKEQMAALKKTDSVYQLTTPAGMPRMATREELGKLTELYNTDWALLVGLDRSDPLKKHSGARTVLTALAKGLPGSKTNPDMLYDLGVKSYIYFLLHLEVIHSARIDDIKLELASVHSEFDGIETICGERWGLWDLGTWCEENDILFLPVQPTRDRQKEAFTELFQLYTSGLFKTPPLRVPGSKGKDILVEEALTFDYSPRLGVYGSPEKDEKYGVQDDAMYSLVWGIWGGKNITVEDFRSRTEELVFGEYRKATDLVGKY